MPSLLARKQKDRDAKIRIWSAGCSTGEEPYSLAMCVLSHLADLRGWDFRILATDISTRALEVAQRGSYSEEKVRRVPAVLRRQYFRKSGDGSKGEFEVIPLLKRIITFHRLNLKDPYPFRGLFDLIFCRNVMIYFDKKTQVDLINRMSSFLRPGGFLCVGHSESLTGLAHKLTYVRPAVYRN